jgi:hypothetical protein
MDVKSTFLNGTLLE